jgi:flavin-dependent dehydrogenase
MADTRADGDRVIVVGGGPAGCAAAITCAQAGSSVLVLDANPAPRDRPGETLHPGVEPLFDRLGVGDAVRAAGWLRHEGIEVTWGAPSRFVAYGADQHGPWRGFQAWRAELDAILRARACALGVEFRGDARAVAPVCDGGVVRGVQTPNAELRARLVIDAAGGTHWLARHLDLPIHKLSRPLLATYGYVRRPPGDAPALRGTEQGWTWRAEVRPGFYQWTRLALATDEPWPDLDCGGEPAGKTRSADVTWRHVLHCAGPGYFMVGDAAAVLDPTSSHGVLRALMTGMRAGHLATSSVSEGADTIYAKWLGAWVSHDVAELTRRYAALGTGAGSADVATVP